MDAISDHTIIEGFLQGTNQDFNLVTGWITEVVNARLWSNGLSRKDIIADTRIKLLHNFRNNSFHGSSSLKTYVQRITRYTIIDHARARKRSTQFLNMTAAPSMDVTTPLTLLEQKEESAIFDRIILLIAEQCRKLWKMILYDSLKYSEIAERLHISEATVKVRVFRCKEEAIAIKKKLT